MKSISTFLIAAGAALIIIGLLARTGTLSWFGRLPGDIRAEGEHTRFYMPITSMIIVSVLLSIIIAVIRRFMR